MTPEPTAALLLDLDGTLVDSEPIQQAGYRAAFAARGWAEVDLARFTGRRAADVFAAEPGPWSGLDPEALAAEVRALVPTDQVPSAIPGAAEVIEAAADAGLGVAIVTSARASWAAIALGELGVRDRVDLVVSGRDVEHGKPHPAGFVLACTRLGVAPASAIAVEDSLAGLAAARAAGVGHVVGVTTSRDAAELLAAGAHAAYADLHPLANRLRQQTATP